MAEIDAAIENELLGGPVNENINEDELLADSPHGNNSVKNEKNDDDLYDEAIAPSNGSFDKGHEHKPATSSTSIISTLSVTSSASGPRYSCYIGNMTWWTTDMDLVSNIASCGVTDLVDVKFFENRINGQSKGFALVTFGSDQSIRILTEKLPLHPIHGQNLAVLSYSKQSLARLEDAAAKTQTRLDSKPAKKEDTCVNMGTIRIGPQPLMGRQGATTMNRPPQLISSQVPMPMVMNGQQLQVQNTLMRSIGGAAATGVGMAQAGVGMVPNAARPVMTATIPPGIPGIPPTIISMQPPMAAAGVQRGYQPQPLMQQHVRPPLGVPPPGAHVNPQVFPGIHTPVISEGEFEEIMNRNRTVSSSAISRAVADASTGDVKSAVETLLTAMSLIKQSRVIHDSRCQLLIASLQDTLGSIESKAYGSSSSRSRHRDRSRSRSRDRDRRRRRRSHSRSRSRSRSPGRYRSSRHY